MATELGRRQGGTRTSEEGPPPWRRVAGIALPLVVVGVVCAIKPEIVRGTFSSAQSVLRVGALLVGWVLFSFLARRAIRNTLLRAAVIAVPAIALLWWNVGPYFREDVTVKGTFSESLATAETTPVAPTPPDPSVGTPTAAAPTPAQPAQPIKVTMGRFRGLDGHRGSGEASVFRQPDGSHVVAFRNLSVSSVPDPVVYLVPGADKEDIAGAIRLGRFDADRDRYEIPVGTSVDGPHTVMIWCQRFAVPVAGASQQPV